MEKDTFATIFGKEKSNTKPQGAKRANYKCFERLDWDFISSGLEICLF